MFTGIGAARFVDLRSAAEKGITVCNCPGYSDNTVAEHALALLLAAARHVPRLDAELRAGRWNQSTMGMELRDARSGRRLRRNRTPFRGAREGHRDAGRGLDPDPRPRNGREPRASSSWAWSACSPNVTQSPLHLAATAETAGLIDAAAIARMKPGALFVNTARGELVDEGALVEALSNGRIRAAGIDVYHEEPLSPSHPLLALDNVVLSPHVAYNTPEAARTLHDIAVECIERYFAGDPVNVVAGPA